MPEVTFPHRRAGHCGSGALRDLLEHRGLSYGSEPLSEGMVFGLGAGLGFFYYELPELTPPFYLVGRTAGLERDLCRHLGIDLDVRTTDDPAEGWEWLRGELDAGRPTMVNADIRELDYLRVRLHNTRHDIVVTGYDPDAGVAFVADNDRDEIQRCSLESLARARGSHGFPGPSHHATWVMAYPDRLPDARSAVTAGVRGAVANMRRGGEVLAGAEGSGGLAQVETFASSYREWPERMGERLPAALDGLRVFVVKAGTGGAMFRSLHARFLEDAAALLGDPGLEEARDAYRALADEWVALARVAADPDSEPGAAHAAAQDHVDAVARLEGEGVEAMERWLG